MLKAGWTRRMLSLAALWLGATSLGGCWVVQDAYEIDLTIEIEDLQPVGTTAGYAAFVYVERAPSCSGSYYGQNVCEILGWDSIEIPGEVTVDGSYDAGDDDCFIGLYVAAYRDGELHGEVDYYPGDRCGVEPLTDPTVRDTPIVVTLDRENCFDDCYWGDSNEEKP